MYSTTHKDHSDRLQINHPVTHSRYYLHQMSTSVVQEHTSVVLMQCVIIPRGHTVVLVYHNIMEMDGFAKVNVCMGFK